VEADSAVTGNVIEDAPTAGIMLGWGRYLRDVTVTGNVVRGAGLGIGVSVSQGAGAAVIADNLIADVRLGALVGMDLKRPVTGDLAKDGAARFAQLAISGNRVR
ncbi:MAG: TIGR03808 family TAT-translocated repetitive protein, partial [Variibacter sp.]|nr:TIGR03808 family TAT-translocated repetitive protein [Variibacter sp.]